MATLPAAPAASVVIDGGVSKYFRAGVVIELRYPPLYVIMKSKMNYRDNQVVAIVYLRKGERKI